MAIGVALFVIVILVAAIWLIIEVKRVRHKVFAIFLIALILFTYISFSVVLKGKDINYGSVSGIVTAGKLYLSWLGSMFGNFKSMTTHAVELDWKSNETSEG